MALHIVNATFTMLQRITPKRAAHCANLAAVEVGWLFAAHLVMNHITTTKQPGIRNDHLRLIWHRPPACRHAAECGEGKQAAQAERQESAALNFPAGTRWDGGGEQFGGHSLTLAKPGKGRFTPTRSASEEYRPCRRFPRWRFGLVYCRGFSQAPIRL